MKTIFILTTLCFTILIGNNSNLKLEESLVKETKTTKTRYSYSQNSDKKFIIIDDGTYTIVGLYDVNDTDNSKLYLVDLKNTEEVDGVVAYTYVGDKGSEVPNGILAEDIKVTLLDLSKLSKKERKTKFETKSKFALDFEYKGNKRDSFTVTLDFEEEIVE